jgi:hypothetical protein
LQEFRVLAEQRQGLDRDTLATLRDLATAAIEESRSGKPNRVGLLGKLGAIATVIQTTGELPDAIKFVQSAANAIGFPSPQI